MLTWHEAATYAASYLDGLEAGLGVTSATTIDVELPDSIGAAARCKHVDVETFVLTAIVLRLEGKR